MISNVSLDALIDSGSIELGHSSFLHSTPNQLTANFWPKIEGMMLGLAIGDSLGNTSEGMSPAKRRANYGEIRDYLPNWHAEGQPIGLPSDDTQLAFWSLEQMLKDGEFIPENLAHRFSQQRIFGIGGTVSGFLGNLKQGIPWYKCGPHSAGNGALMRIAPMLIPHLHNPSSKLWSDTALSAMMTHNDAASIASCIIFIRILWDCLSMDTAPESQWWVDRFTTTLATLDTGKMYSPRGGKYMHIRDTYSNYVSKIIEDALSKKLSTLDACNNWYSGAYLLETLPCIIYILAKHGHDPEEAIVRAVNDTRDNDTVAAIVGAAVGALHGVDGLPSRWVNNLSGRTGANDDGKVFDLLEQTKRKWIATDTEY